MGLHKEKTEGLTVSPVHSHKVSAERDRIGDSRRLALKIVDIAHLANTCELIQRQAALDKQLRVMQFGR